MQEVDCQCGQLDLTVVLINELRDCQSLALYNSQ